MHNFIFSISVFLSRISFLDLELIRLADGGIITNWYRKNTYSGRILNFLSFHPFSNKIAVVKNLVDRAIGLSHDSFHYENLNIIRKILFLNHYPPALIEKKIKIRLEQKKNKTKQNNSLLTDLNMKVRDYSSFNTFVFPYFGQISKTIQSMLKKFKIRTIFSVCVCVCVCVCVSKMDVVCIAWIYNS